MARVTVRSGPGLEQEIRSGRHALVAELDVARVYADDCVRCEAPGAMVDRITRRITVIGELDAAQVARLADIATKCPVHKTLLAGLRVEDEIVVAMA